MRELATSGDALEKAFLHTLTPADQQQLRRMLSDLLADQHGPD